MRRTDATGFRFESFSASITVAAAVPAFMATRAAGRAAIPRMNGFASCPPARIASSVEWASNACRAANEAYSPKRRPLFEVKPGFCACGTTPNIVSRGWVAAAVSSAAATGARAARVATDAEPVAWSASAAIAFEDPRINRTPNATMKRARGLPMPAQRASGVPSLLRLVQQIPARMCTEMLSMNVSDLVANFLFCKRADQPETVELDRLLFSCPRPRRLQAKQAFQALEHRNLVAAFAVKGLEDVEAFLDGWHSANAQLACARRNLALLTAPHENRPCFGIDGDVEAVLRSIVDEDVKLQGGRDLAARSVDDED